jgi:hypothetical protein
VSQNLSDLVYRHAPTARMCRRSVFGALVHPAADAHRSSGTVPLLLKRSLCPPTALLTGRIREERRGKRTKHRAEG